MDKFLTVMFYFFISMQSQSHMRKTLQGMKEGIGRDVWQKNPEVKIS